MINKEKRPIKLNWILFLLLISSVVFFYFKDVRMNNESKKQTKELNSLIKDLKKQNENISVEILGLKESMKIVDDNVNKLEGQKTIIKEIYHEKISSITNYTEYQLDSFFTARYKY